MSEPSPGSGARAQELVLAALLALVLGLYWRTAQHGFVAYDDPLYVSENPLVARGLTLEGLRWAFAFQAGNWHPLTWLSHMLDAELFGLEPGAHHLVSAALHALNTALLFLLVRRLTGAGWSALFAAALFTLHPLRAESVAWASERKDVLSGTFWLLALLAYERYARQGGARRYALVGVCLALGLLAKSMLVTLPLVLLLLDVWPLARCGPETRAALLREKLPFLALALAAGSATLWIQQSEGAVGTLHSLSLAERTSNACLTYWIYLAKTLVPAGLACFVPHPVVVTPREELARVLFWPGLLAFVALVAVTALAFLQRRARPHLLLGWTWYLVAAAPVIGFVQVGQQAYADRYTYLPMIGPALALAFELRALAARRPRLRPMLAGGCALVLAALVPLSARQIDTWHDSRTLFTHALAVTGHNYLAGTFLGEVERRKGELEAARAHLEQALVDNKFHVPAMLELGLTLTELGDLSGARKALKRTLRNDPANAPAQRALLEVERRLGDDPSPVER
jgi:tetratricopeptide (TPR) repeat protein